MARLIELTQGYSAVVDDEDHDWLSKYSWCALIQPSGHVYAIARVRVSNAGRNGGWKTVRMHRLIKGDPIGRVVDHRDHDTLNNQRDNLRIASQKQNAENRSANKTGRKKSQFKGVTLGDWNPNPKWIASITPDRKRIYLGSFKTEEDAARAYDQAAIQHFGEFADINFKETLA